MKPPTPAQNERDRLLAEFCAQFYHDPLGFVYGAFPWGIKGGPLEFEEGPDANQITFLTDLARETRARAFDSTKPVMPVRMAEASGHGTGKTVLGAWIACWILSTRPHSVGTITAGTKTQLKTRTWAGIRNWLRMCVTEPWFEIGVEKIFHKLYPDTWNITAQTCKSENAQSFAGQHAKRSTSWYLFDEASRVPDEVWDVAYGGLTDGEPMFFAWGQPERREGRFYEICFNKERDRWIQHSVDSRNSRFTNKPLIQEWIDDHGIDSDFVRVRILGQPPLAAAGQYIDAGRVMQAQRRPPVHLKDDPLIVGLDVARGGLANTVFRFRRGLDAASIPAVRLTGEQSRDSMRVAALAGEILSTEYGGVRPSAMFVDSGFGGPIVDRLHQLNHPNAIEISFGGRPPDRHFANMRSFMWGKLKDFLLRGSIDKEERLENDLTAPWFHHNSKDELVLESKDEMLKRDIASPDDGDALALTFAQPVGPLQEPDQDEEEEEFGSALGRWGSSGWMR